MNRESLCETVHRLFESLPARQGRPLEGLPRDGIYFWYEKGETRDGGGARVTRVGTHESRGRQPRRILENFNSNREGSVFRKHVGGALMARDGEREEDVREWRKARRSPRFHDALFEQYESRVTAELLNGGYRAVKVDDIHERLGLKEKLIALFSHCQHCRPSPQWLGHWAASPAIRDSGLWNVRHVCSPNELRETDLGRLEQLVRDTLAGN